jgi:hypothetical protein
MSTLAQAGCDENNLCFPVSFKVRASLSTGTSTVQLSSKADGSAVHPYDFFCAVWMGADNPNVDIKRLKSCPDGTGEAVMTLPVLKGDADMFKIGVYVVDPDTHICRHLTSGFETMEWLHLAMSEASDFSQAKRSLLLKDNYSKNKVLFHFCNSGTDVKAFGEYRKNLRLSVLHINEEINKKVLEMSFGVHNWIEHSSNVSSRNGGPSFVNPVCFTEAMGCVINYPLLNITYGSERHRAPLPMLAYMGLSTIHYVGMSVENLLKLSDQEFMNRYVVPLCSSFTVCPKSSIYAGDKTLNAEGGLDQMTENFAMVLSAHLFIGLKDRQEFRDRFLGMLSKMSVDELVTHYSALVDHPDLCSATHPLITDDCETLTGMIKSFEGAIYQYHLESVAECQRKASMQVGAPANGSVDASSEHDVTLGQMMWNATRGMQNMSAVPLQDFISLGRLLGRYGRLRSNGDKGQAPSAQIGLCIVSAKGPKFSTTNSELNGHACAVAQTLSADGSAYYTIAEGTSNMTCRDLPNGCLQSVVLPLTTGDKSFGTLEALTIIAESLGELTSTCGTTRVGQFIQQTFKGTDPYVSCPFYMAGFFMGLEMNSCTPGVIPLDTRGGLSFVCGDATGTKEGAAPAPGASTPGPTVAQPVFGAPVAALADDSVRALPINLEVAMGGKEAQEFLLGFRTRNDETYMPRLPLADALKLMCPWGPIQPIDAAGSAKFDHNKTWISSSAEAFENADVLRVVYEYKKRVADKFNALQAADAGSDGVRMEVRCHMLSVVCHFHVPLPTQEKWGLSCARNMKHAVSDMPQLKKKEVTLASSSDRVIA